MESSFITITEGFLIRLVVMLVIFFIDNMEPKLKVAILFLLDAVDCGYTQLVNHKNTGTLSSIYCNDPYYIIGDEFLDILSYIMAFQLLGLSKYYFILVGLRLFATIMYIWTGNKRWFLMGPDAIKELIMYSWFYPLNYINIAVIIGIKTAVEYYYL